MTIRRLSVLMLATTFLSTAAFAEKPATSARSTLGDQRAAPRMVKERAGIPAAGETSAANTNATNAQSVPAATRETIGKADLVTQARFWSDEFAKAPQDLDAALALSDVLQRIGSFDRAVAVCQQALQFHGGNGRLWANLGYAYLGATKGPEAIGPLQRAIGFDGKNARLHSALGVAYDQAGRPDLARTAYEQALSLAPNDPAILTNLGFSWVLGGDLKKAEATLTQAVANPTAPPQARQNLAMVVALQGRFAEAERIAATDVPPELAAQNIAWVRSMVDQPRRWDSVRGGQE